MDPTKLITGLAARASELTTEPPAKARYRDARHYQIAIAGLEAKLGITDGMPSWNLLRCERRLSELERRVEAAGLSIAPATATRLPADTTAPPTDSGARLLARYEAITNPAKKTEFYKANAAAMDAAHRQSSPKPVSEAMDFAHRQSSPKPVTRKLTGDPTIDQHNAISDPIERTLHYREHARQIDLAYRELNRKR